jgi:hypothetical protein
MKPRLFAALALAVGSFGLVGCGNPVTTIETIVSASEAAIPILEAAGVPIPAQVPQYLADVNQCIAQEPGGSLNTAELAAIAGCLTALVAPTLTGLPGAIVSSISAVIQDVAKYLTQVSPTASANPATPSADQKMKAQSLRTRAAAVVVVAKARAMKR